MTHTELQWCPHMVHTSHGQRTSAGSTVTSGKNGNYQSRTDAFGGLRWTVQLMRAWLPRFTHYIIQFQLTHKIHLHHKDHRKITSDSIILMTRSRQTGNEWQRLLLLVRVLILCQLPWEKQVIYNQITTSRFSRRPYELWTYVYNIDHPAFVIIIH